MVLTSQAYVINNKVLPSQESTQGPHSPPSGSPSFSHTELLVHRHVWSFKTSVRARPVPVRLPLSRQILIPFWDTFQNPFFWEAFLTLPGLAPSSVPTAPFVCVYHIILCLESSPPPSLPRPTSSGVPWNQIRILCSTSSADSTELDTEEALSRWLITLITNGGHLSLCQVASQVWPHPHLPLRPPPV